MAMRKVLLVASVVFACIVSVSAQRNAAVNPSEKKEALKEQAEKIQKDADSTGGNADMIKLKADEVPGVLKKTLQSVEYRGWDAEGSTISGSEENDLYVVEILRSNQPKTFYFDGEGKPIKY